MFQANADQEGGRVGFIPEREQSVPKPGEACHGAANPCEVGQACQDGDGTPHLSLVRSIH